jgi:hypothetical protein
MRPEEILSLREKQERQLWAAVIMQALDDATGVVVNADGRSKEGIRRRARDWFIKGGRDFKEVCALAGMEPDWIRANALKRIEEVGDGEISKRLATITHNGERITLKELSARTGVSIAALYSRVKAGKTGDQLTAPVGSLQKVVEITHNGETHTADEWSEITGIKAGTILGRLKDGWTTEEALTPGRRMRPAKMTKRQKQALGGCNRSAPKEPRRPKGKLYTHAGRSLTLANWSIVTGIPLNTLHVRLSRQGWSIEQALSTPLIDPSKRRAGAAARAA